MIKDTIEELPRYASVIPRWDLIVPQLKLELLADMDVGRYDLEDGVSYFLIAHYQSRTYHENQFEYHRKFIDIQVVLEGIELIYTAPVSRMMPDDAGYDPENDIQFGTTSVPDVLMLKAGDVAVFFPEDAHNPNCSVGKHHLDVKKAIFKVPAL